MKRVICDGLIGMVVAPLGLILVTGLMGFFGGFVLDGPDAEYGWNGALGMAVLWLLVYGIPVASVGLVTGALLGVGYRMARPG